MAMIKPKWHRELDLFRMIKPCLIMEGNIFDTYQYPGDCEIPEGSIIQRLPEYLHYYFRSVGYDTIAMYDDIHGYHNPYDPGFSDKFSRLASVSTFRDGATGAAFSVGEALRQNAIPTVIIMDFASRYITDPSNLSHGEVDGFTMLLQAALDAREVRTEEFGTLKNLCVLLVNKLNDLPAWFYLDNPHVKPILLQTPEKEERTALVKGDNFRIFFQRDTFEAEMPYYADNPKELEKIQDKFIGLTEGFTFTELNALRKLCRGQNLSIRNLCSVIDLYKFGIQENPWNKLSLDAFQNAEDDFENRVKGQKAALGQTLDVVKRAITGMSDITANTHGKPKGVLFFAGPTGTGKTETAKTLAEKLFGDESACIRFDMSEYSQPHSDQRLLGAPPGYVGYESGGQLTNAVKNNPFSILLFDEIEKAHPSILDKFLQILEDGRMTDGKGETVYFSECIIIFTSNLGIYEMQANGLRRQVVQSEMAYPEVRKAVRKGIEQYFKEQLGRPEILNRIGENIVVFDFIREPVAEEILRAQLNKIIANMRTSLNVELQISETVFRTLLEKALENLDNGGRGIGNIVESMFINPLSRYMFDNNHFKNCGITVQTLHTDQMPYIMECEIPWQENVG